MNWENIELMQDAWFILRDVLDSTGNKEVSEIMGRLHTLIDNEIEKAEETAA